MDITDDRIYPFAILRLLKVVVTNGVCVCESFNACSNDYMYFIMDKY